MTSQASTASSYREIFQSGLWSNTPGMAQLLGLCPLLAVSRGCDAAAIGRDIHHPHPTLGETVGLAASLAHGSCTDLPAMARRAVANRL